MKNYLFKNTFFSSKGQLSPKGFLGNGIVLSALIILISIISVSFLPFIKESKPLLLLNIAVLGASFLVFIYSAIVIGVKRCHSLGVSGWSLILSPFSIIGTVIFPVILTYSLGENKKNKYGAVDKKQFKRNWFEKTMNWLLETLNGRLVLVFLGVLFSILGFLLEEATLNIEYFFYFISFVFAVLFALRLKSVESRIKKIIIVMNYIGAVVLSICVIGVFPIIVSMLLKL